jgi:flavin-dependent dehydrogenase
VRIETGQLDVAAAFDPKWVKESGGLGQAAARILRDSGFPPIERLETFGWRGTPLLTRRAIKPSGERVFALGDAAGYVEPFTGEGMSWALASGVAAGSLAYRICRLWRPNLATRWSILYHHHITRRQRLCRIVADVLRRPLLLGWLVAAMDRMPALAAPLMRYLNFVPPSRKGF